MKLFLPITICFFPLIGLCQEAITDTIALPTLETTDVPKEVDLERVMSKIWELDREDQQGTFHLYGVPTHVYHAYALHRYTH